MYYDGENKCMTDAELYNLADDVSKLSQTYSVGCHDQLMKHTNKAYKGFWFTIFSLGITGVGCLYTLFHHGTARYYSGAEDTYRKYTDLTEDMDSISSAWRDLDPELREQIKRFKK